MIATLGHSPRPTSTCAAPTASAAALPPDAIGMRNGALGRKFTRQHSPLKAGAKPVKDGDRPIVRGRPPGLAIGKCGSISAHAASLISVPYRLSILHLLAEKTEYRVDRNLLGHSLRSVQGSKALPIVRPASGKTEQARQNSFSRTDEAAEVAPLDSALALAIAVGQQSSITVALWFDFCLVEWP